MEASQIAALAKLLANVHTDNFKKITSNSSLRRYSGLKAVEAKKIKAPIFYSDLPMLRLEHELKFFFTSPNGQSPYVIVDVDKKNEWIKLLRFLVTKHGEINAEAVCLCGKNMSELKGFGYRFEHPEKFDNDKHGFFHVQPIGITETEIVIPVRPDWLPVSFPTFYMFASCAYELILYSIHALSGWELLNSYRNKNIDKNPVLSMLVRVGHKASAPYPGLC